MNPILISWNITKQCNLACVHCYRDAGAKDENELTTQEAFALVDEIASCGFKVLILSGGEPLVRKDVFEIAKYAAGKGLRVVLGTNGTLITKKIARKCKDSGIARAGVSIDSLNEKKHNKFRNDPRAFKRAINGIRNLKAEGVEFQIHTTVTKRNSEELFDINNFAKIEGARAHHLFFLVSAGRGKGIESDQISPPEQEDILKNIVYKIKNGLIEIETKPTCAPEFMRIAKQEGVDTPYTKGCLAGTSYCVILPGGDVHPCPYLPVNAGNVRVEKLSHIWEKAEVFKKLRHNGLKGRCGACNYKNICGGCRAQAYARYGDYMAQDPFCTKTE